MVISVRPVYGIKVCFGRVSSPLIGACIALAPRCPESRLHHHSANNTASLRNSYLGKLPVIQVYRQKDGRGAQFFPSLESLVNTAIFNLVDL